MSEVRKNPFTGEWTIYAENRKHRPYEFIHKTEVKNNNGENCPFCGGHEGWTTKALYQDGENDNWDIRVFPNKFPTVSENPAEAAADGFYEQLSGRGMHEILVDTPLHDATIDEFSEGSLRRILTVLQKRYILMSENEAVAYIQIFKNCGPSAGMSIRHSHWQIVGLPMTPQRESAMARHMKKEDCLFCKMLEHEKNTGLRMAGENEFFAALTPYASRFPYELWLCPKRHISTYDCLDSDEIAALAGMLKSALQGVVSIRSGIGYNICFIGGGRGEDFHWHMEILPRIGGFAGFEFATGSYINSVFPEEAALYYREYM